jgi:hypothetical protein
MKFLPSGLNRRDKFHERRTDAVTADEIDVCIIFCAVFGQESGESYCASLGMPWEVIKRLLYEGRYRGWKIG